MAQSPSSQQDISNPAQDTKINTYKIAKPGMLCLHLDAHYNHDSAVYMPTVVSGEGDGASPQLDDIEGLDTIVKCYWFAKKNEDKKHKLLISGHTDRSGGPEYNWKLSKKRAEGVTHLIMGNRQGWVTVAKEWYQGCTGKATGSREIGRRKDYE